MIENKLNKNCACCYKPFKEPTKFTYCFDCNKLSKDDHKCQANKKNGDPCKAKALNENDNFCFFHKKNVV